MKPLSFCLRRLSRTCLFYLASTPHLTRKPALALLLALGLFGLTASLQIRTARARAAIVPVQSGSLSCGQLTASTIAAAGEVDQYTFNGQANEKRTLTLAASGFPFEATATAIVLAPSGGEVARINASSQRQLMLTESGTYLIQVRANNLVSSGSYSIGLECLSPTSPVDTTLFCGLLLPNRRLSGPGQVDQITFIGQANQRVTLTLAASGFPFEATATATVFSPAAVDLATFNANDQRLLTLTESGTYIIQVRANNFVSTGSYSLGLQCLPAHVSAASFSAVELATESIAAIFGSQLATETRTAMTLPLPTTLGGTMVKVKDSLNVERSAPLFFVSPDQVNLQIPLMTATGTATVTIISGNGATVIGTTAIATAAPGLFAANANGRDVAAGLALRVKANGAQSYEEIARLDPAQGRYGSVPIDLGPAGERVFLILFGTGFRYRSALSAVSLRIGGTDANVLYADRQGDFVGLDQLNAEIPRSLIGRNAELDVVLTVDGKTANTVRVAIK